MVWGPKHLIHCSITFGKYFKRRITYIFSQESETVQHGATQEFVCSLLQSNLVRILVSRTQVFHLRSRSLVGVSTISGVWDMFYDHGTCYREIRARIFIFRLKVIEFQSQILINTLACIWAFLFYMIIKQHHRKTSALLKYTESICSSNWTFNSKVIKVHGC